MACNYPYKGLISWRLPLVPAAPRRAGRPGRRQTVGDQYVPYAGLTAEPPTLVTGGMCLVGGNTKSYYVITKCKHRAADPGQVGRRGLSFSAKISPVYWRMPRDCHPEDDYMSLPVLCGSAALLTRATAIVAKGKEVSMEGGLRRFSRACALAQACRCEVRT